MIEVLIIGYGTVGKNLASELATINPDIFDKYKTKFNSKRKIIYDVAFICVDTPYISDDNPCDISEVYDAISENEAKIYVIKSTVLPGTCDHLHDKLNKKIVFSPEYYGSTHFTNNYRYNFPILGGEKHICSDIIQILQDVYDCRHKFAITDCKTAELTKYMENAFLATKVSFCTQFWQIAQESNVNYQELRELFLLDPRINPSNTFVFNSHPFWESHCYNKDLAAIAIKYNAKLLLDIIDFNNNMKKMNNENEV